MTFLLFKFKILQHLPDFKGIETHFLSDGGRTFACSTSLTSKGLRLFSSVPSSSMALQHLPDFKGIETPKAFQQSSASLLQHLPDFKGIETQGLLSFHNAITCSTSLTSKGLRPCLSLLSSRLCSCSTSLTSKGLRLVQPVKQFGHPLAAPP